MFTFSLYLCIYVIFIHKEHSDEDIDKDKGASESWLDWIKRTTSVAEEHLRATGLDDWVVAQRKRNWAFAGHVARRTDMRWSSHLLKWCPQDGYA